jgi:hypothetical protein
VASPSTLGLSIPVPIAHADSPPSGLAAEVFTSSPATDWNESWVGIDIPTARRVGRRILRAFQDLDSIYPR